MSKTHPATSAFRLDSIPRMRDFQGPDVRSKDEFSGGGQSRIQGANDSNRTLPIVLPRQSGRRLGNPPGGVVPKKSSLYPMAVCCATAFSNRRNPKRFHNLAPQKFSFAGQRPKRTVGASLYLTDTSGEHPSGEIRGFKQILFIRAPRKSADFSSFWKILQFAPESPRGDSCDSWLADGPCELMISGCSDAACHGQLPVWTPQMGYRCSDSGTPPPTFRHDSRAPHFPVSCYS